jgi:hypothetical protein
MQVAVLILSGTAVVFGVAAYLTWSICIHRYVQYYRCEPALFFLPWAPLVDSRKAARIARRLGHAPGWLKLYRRCEAMAVCLAVISAILWLLWYFQIYP